MMIVVVIGGAFVICAQLLIHLQQFLQSEASTFNYSMYTVIHECPK